MGRCPTPRQGWQGHAPSFSLHPRHVCDVPKGHRGRTRSTQRLTVAPQGRSVLRSLFSVLWGGNAAPWFFSAFVGAAQRSASSPPKAAARASTSVAPPSLQTSKLPSFFGAFFVSFVFSPKHSTLSHRLYRSRACRAFRSLFSVLQGRPCRPLCYSVSPALRIASAKTCIFVPTAPSAGSSSPYAWRQRAMASRTPVSVTFRPGLPFS